MENYFVKETINQIKKNNCLNDFFSNLKPYDFNLQSSTFFKLLEKENIELSYIIPTQYKNILKKPLSFISEIITSFIRIASFYLFDNNKAKYEDLIFSNNMQYYI